jgi:hypothetical protein
MRNDPGAQENQVYGADPGFQRIIKGSFRAPSLSVLESSGPFPVRRGKTLIQLCTCSHWGFSVVRTQTSPFPWEFPLLPPNGASMGRGRGSPARPDAGSGESPAQKSTGFPVKRNPHEEHRRPLPVPPGPPEGFPIRCCQPEQPFGQLSMSLRIHTPGCAVSGIALNIKKH